MIPAKAVFTAVLLALVAEAAAGETRTFTSRDGRTLEAELLGYRGEELRLRRADNGKELRLPLSSLSEDDQRAVRLLMKENPSLRDAVKPTDIRVEFSRAKFEREQTDRAYWINENTESWGFSIAVVNQTNLPIEGLRVDYVVFALKDPDKVYSAQKTSRAADLERITGSENIGVIASGQRLSVRTKPVVSIRTKYTEGSKIITADGKLRSSWRDKELHGVWLRVYDGDRLVQEHASSESLRASGKGPGTQGGD